VCLVATHLCTQVTDVKFKDLHTSAEAWGCANRRAAMESTRSTTPCRELGS